MELNRNLAPLRGPSVWTRDLTPFTGRPVPRMAIAGAGLGLLAAALMSPRTKRGMLACTGASLVAFAGAGARWADLARWAQRRFDHWRTADQVTEASEESFPASDSPSWSPAIAGAPERQRR